MLMRMRSDSRGGVAEKIASTPLGRTSVHTNLDRILTLTLSPLLVSIHFSPSGFFPVHLIASATEAYSYTLRSCKYLSSFKRAEWTKWAGRDPPLTSSLAIHPR